jgi:hypothetical protein
VFAVSISTPAAEVHCLLTAERGNVYVMRTAGKCPSSSVRAGGQTALSEALQKYLNEPQYDLKKLIP